jgi:rhamnosyltransferase
MPTNATDALRAPPRVLVLMATFNGATWLDEQLASIFEQGGVRTSLLVLDDGSADASLDIIGRWRARGFDIELLSGPSGRRGAASTFFALLCAASANAFDAVALADQDDVWEPGRLARALRVLSEGQVAGYSSDAMAFWADGRERRLGKAFPQAEADHLFEPAGPGCTYVLAPALIRAVQAALIQLPSCIEGVGYHDWWLYAFARANGFAWHIDDRATVRYRQHAHNELGANFGIKGVRRRWSRLTSGWYREQILLLAQAWSGHQEEAQMRLRRFGPGDRLWFALRARRFRRRPRDQLALAAMLLAGVMR